MKTSHKILPGQSEFTAKIYFRDGHRFHQRGDFLNQNPFLQLHDLKAWIKTKLQETRWKYEVIKIEIYDNTQLFENSRSLNIWRKIDHFTGEIYPWNGSARNEKYILFDFPGLRIENKITHEKAR